MHDGWTNDISKFKNMRKKRIFFFFDAFGYGGAEKQLAFVAEGMTSRGHKIAILNLNLRGSHEGMRKVDNRIKIYTGEVPYRNSLCSTIDYLKLTIEKAKAFNADIIIGFKQLGFYSVVAGKWLKIPSIIAERADPFRSYKKARASLRFKLWFVNHATGGVFQTKQAASFYSKRLREKGTIIPNPIFIKGDIPQQNYSNLPKVILSLGRLDNYQKRLDVMIDAFEKFHTRHPDYTLKIYGNGEDERFLRELVRIKGLSDCVCLMGVSNDSIQDLSSGGIFLITSDFEGISNSLLEAMACGLPVVSTDHTPGGARMLISDGENGLLTPIGDAAAISNALCRYVEEVGLAEHCGRNAQNVLMRFSPEHILDLWEDYLVSIK